VRRVRGRLVAVLVAAALVLPSAAAVASDPADELGRARGDLDAASRDLAEVEAAVRRAGDEVAAAEDRLRAATTDLDRVRGELVAAEGAAVAAAAAERDAAAALQAVTDELDALVARHGAGRDQLASQAVTAFKRGTSATSGLLFGGVVRAGDWHEVAVTREVVNQVLADQQRVVDEDAELTIATAAASAGVADARRRAIDTSRDAAAERQRVHDLVAEQETLTARVGRELDSRATALASLEADATARAVLVRGLEERVAELQRAALAARVPVRADVAVDGPAPAWAAGLPPAGRTWAPAIAAAAATNGIDGRLLAALVWTESNFRPDAVSHAGAIGLTQLMPGTARGLGVDPHDPVDNLHGGARYLAAQLDTFGRADLALAAYNAGPGRVQAAGGAVPDIVETQLYVVRVLDRYQALARLG
jgi:soluble lytic murein transglycosylase-like protein